MKIFPENTKQSTKYLLLIIVSLGVAVFGINLENNIVLRLIGSLLFFTGLIGLIIEFIKWLRKKMKKTSIVIILLISLLLTGIVLIILANVKSPEVNKNLLSYWKFHSKSWQCHIVQQTYKDVTYYKIDRACAEEVCRKKATNTKLDLFCDIEIGDHPWRNESFMKANCYKGIEIRKEESLPTQSGQMVKYYYFGVPVLRESCPENYKI